MYLLIFIWYQSHTAHLAKFVGGSFFLWWHAYMWELANYSPWRKQGFILGRSIDEFCEVRRYLGSPRITWYRDTSVGCGGTSSYTKSSNRVPRCPLDFRSPHFCNIQIGCLHVHMRFSPLIVIFIVDPSFFYMKPM